MLGEDRYFAQVQATLEAELPPYCEKCGCSLHGCYAYDTPEGLYCENCKDELLYEYSRDWEVDADEWEEGQHYDC